ncbi:MAG: VWA domain-containing protein [Promethearchaeota archaeon]
MEREINIRLIFILGVIISLGVMIPLLFASNSYLLLSDEIRQNIISKSETITSLQADQVRAVFGRTESLVKATTLFAEQIWNGSIEENVTSYYHNLDVSPAPPNLHYDPNYGREIDTEYSAFKLAYDAFESSYQQQYLNYVETESPWDHINSTIEEVINKSAKLDLIWRDLYATNPDHTWLYMGFEIGLHRSFPWHGPFSKSYDPRKRAWYVGSATGPKDIVLIMDESGSMSGSKIENTKVAMNDVLSTLGAQDRFSVIRFSSFVDTFNELEIATPSLVSDAKSWVNDAYASGSTNINGALLEALNILKNGGYSDRTPIIIFMTDGEPTAGETNTNQILLNVQSANSIGARIFVFGLGSDLNYGFLNDLASQNNGEAVYIWDSSYLSDAMTGFYRFFQKSGYSEKVIWSWPYVDASGKGMVITASKSVIYNGSLLGVVGADLTLNSLFSYMDQLKISSSGYNYIFDMGKIAVLHPSFKSLEPGDWQEDAIRRPISELESSSGAYNNLVQNAINYGRATDIIKLHSIDYVVSMSRVGSTSLIYATSTPVNAFLDESSNMMLNSLRVEGYIIMGVISAVGVALSILYYKYLQKRGW